MSRRSGPGGHETTVLVVGAGATGCGVARDLAMRGVDVVLADRGAPTAGTSGRSHGLLHSGARYAPGDPESVEACVAESQTMREIAGACVADTGGLFVQLPDDDPEYFAAKRAACERLGVPVETLDADAVREIEPAITPAVERGLWVSDAVVYPSRLVAATAAGAREHGATLRFGDPVTDLHVEDGRVTGATVGGDRLRASHVVNATGAWAGELAALAGVEVEMAPTRGVMAVVEQPEPRVRVVCNRCRPPSDGDIVVPHPSTAVLGTTSVAVDDPDDPGGSREEVARVREECVAMLPGVADTPEVASYWGVRPLYAGGDEDDGESEDESRRSISRGFHVLDHAARDGVAGLTTVVGGKLTTHRLMAERVADRVADRLGVTADCTTAETPLPGHDDPARLDALVAAFGGPGPADADVVGDW